MSLRHHIRSLRARWRIGLLFCAALALTTVVARMAVAGPFWTGWWGAHKKNGDACAPGDHCAEGDWGGQWYWMGSPEEQKRITISQYNRYCIRCHGVDGHGVWDIPDVPDFTNARWQASRSDFQLVRLILEGRGAVMPAFRGTLSLEEAWSMARYLRTFLPGLEASRPDLGSGAKQPTPAAPGPMNP